jgi:carboxylate-amine ligase
MERSLRFEIEEQLFLVDTATGEAARAIPRGFLDAAKQATGGRVTREMPQSQIEIATLPHYDMKTARAELRHLRQTIAKVADEHGLAILAAGAFPTAGRFGAAQTNRAQTEAVRHNLHMISRRNLMCGLNVHVELPDPDERIPVMMRMLPYLPLFVALVAPAPFWQSPAIGLKCFRLAAADGTWMPEIVHRNRDLAGDAQMPVRDGRTPDSSHIWWGIRPSPDHAKLELRTPDCYPVVDDAIAIAALFRVLARRLTLAPALNFGLDAIAHAIAAENKSRTRSNAVRGANLGEDDAATISELLDAAIEETTADAVALGCLTELLRCRTIAGAATSADAQPGIRLTPRALEDHAKALEAVTSRTAIATLH